MSGWLPVIAGTGSAVAGGFYFAFSAVVMPALRGQPATEAIATMLSTNEKAVLQGALSGGVSLGTPNRAQWIMDTALQVGQVRRASTAPKDPGAEPAAA